MEWELSLTTHHLLWIGAVPVSAALTFGMARLMPAWLAALIAAPLPALAILAWFFYRETQQPVGPFLAIVGIWHAVPALLAGAAAAVVTAFCLALRDAGSPTE